MTVSIDLSGQTAIVTGAGRGIGREIAKRYAEAGANIVAVARTESEIEATAASAQSFGVDAIAVSTDLAEVSDIDNLIEKTVEEFDTPHILVNNAAANLANPPLDQSIEEIDTMIDVNFRGLFLLAQRFAQEARDADINAGRIINISSIGARLGIPVMATYGATKGGVNALTRALAADLASDNVTVNSISPGLTRSERVENIIEEKGRDNDIYDLDQIPIGRVADPQEIADVCLFVASSLSRYMTGEDILVDGGVCLTARMYK